MEPEYSNKKQAQQAGDRGEGSIRISDATVTHAGNSGSGSREQSNSAKEREDDLNQEMNDQNVHDVHEESNRHEPTAGTDDNSKLKGDWKQGRAEHWAGYCY